MSYSLSFGQSAPITIDGLFDDWDSSLATFTDEPESINGIDILSFQVTNDDKFLFVKVVVDQEFDLTENLFPHDLFLYIDADNNASTGYSVQSGFGSELGIKFVDNLAYYDVTPSSTVHFEDIQLRPAPTVSGNEFEIAIGRDVIPDGINPLFPSNTIKLKFKEWNDGDNCPNNGQFFEYTFDETPVTPLIPTDITKESPELIRVMAYNTWANGLTNATRQPHIESLVKAADADIYGFSESNTVSSAVAKNLMDAWIPLGTSDGWYTLKNGDLITASKWPITDSWTNLDNQFPVLIDLPLEYGTDLLFVNAHWSCCGSNGARQDQSDMFCEFFLDAKTEGGIIDLVPNTPMIYVGDLNLVGYAQQLETLVTGDVVQTSQFGDGAPLDWDNTDLKDQICVQTDKRMAYTWRKDSESNFPPGRLDFIVFTDAVLSAEKSFTIQTEVMPQERLDLYNLDEFDTNTASDHFPVITDFMVFEVADLDEDGIIDEIDNCIDVPNTDQADWNNNGVGDVCEDSDGDGLLDADEILVYNTDPDNIDSDNDGLEDGFEVNVSGTEPLIQDTDGDGLTDSLELNISLTDPLLVDSDGDGCEDYLEFSNQCGDGPCDGDANNDGIVNVLDIVAVSSNFGGGV